MVTTKNHQFTLKGLRRSWYGKILIAFLVFWIIFFIFDLFIMPRYTRHGQEVIVPNVEHLSVDAAEKILFHKGFKLVRGEATYDSYYPQGFVLFQNPAAGSKVKKGRRIYVTVCKGERFVEMPKLIDLNLSNTRHALKSYDLDLGNIDLEYNSQFEDTIVVFQSVPAGDQVKIGTIIDVICKVKPLGKSTVPDLIGISLMEAKEKIKDAKLTLGEITYQKAAKLLPLTVIQQSLKAGITTTTGDTISIIVTELPQTSTPEDTLTAPIIR